jgi:hypothetical protein
LAILRLKKPVLWDRLPVIEILSSSYYFPTQ